MLRVRVAGALLALTLLGSLAGCGGTRPPGDAPPPAGILATWTDETLTADDFEAAYHASEGSIVDSMTTPAARRADFLERYVDFRLKVKAARAAGYDRDSAYRAEVEQYRDQLAGPYFMDREVLDDIVRDIYDKQAEQVAVSHLLLRLDPFALDTAAVFARAIEIRDSIRAGQTTFEAAARRYSEDPSVERNDGALGYITGGQTVLPFEDAAYGAAVGEVAGPVRTQFGVHLLKVTDRRPAPGEVRAAHILLRPDSPTAADTAAARAEIEALRARVVAGESFATLARQYSDDPGSGAEGGDLGFFGGGRMVPQFEQAAFALANPGDLSGAVQTQFGYHLIQLTERRARPTYDEQYETLKNLAQRLPQTALRRRALGRRYRQENGGSYDEALVREAIFSLPADSALVVLGRDGFGPAYDGRVFSTVGDSTFTLGRLAGVIARVRAADDPRPALVQAAQAWADEQAVSQAVAGLEDRDPEFARIFRSYADGVLYFRIAEDSVWTRARDDEQGLRAHYAAHASEYRWPDRRRVLAFRSPGDSVLTAVGEALDAGTPPAAVLAQFSAPRFALALDTVFVADSTQSILDSALSLAPGEHTAVVAERSRLAVYLYDGMEPARPKTFDEARAEVISAYQESLERTWERRLRERYHARTFPDRIPPPMLRRLPSSVQPPPPER